MKEFTVSSPTNLRDFTDCTYPQASFCLAALLKSKDIKVNGVRVKSNVNLCVGDRVIYYTTTKQEAKESHFKVYADENILVADKLSGVSYEGLLSELNRTDEYFGVHRLDRNTSGLIIFAKTKACEQILITAFKDRKVHKTYRALCKNNFKSGNATLTAYLFKGDDSTVKISDTERAGYKKIITKYCVLEERGDVAEVEINLLTGRTHQIRAHFAHIGCPVLGDNKYGDGALNKKYHLQRQCLVAKYLTFDKIEGLEYLENMKFESTFNL